mmetsp:Transcript_17565/g.41389  ORF Transcript_17565/g.41389 Transcript_17565/m.41389 type:complete len:305 (-) Transcript_17565:105-1019(-)|eukprot:CAMPEP_0114557798 /NCGR_PEP_ID=MMETSP0114-20121206/10027_1 /TAXON_ID=31324 /ORGANISM="Goniomonas sp, Strain m" /LENGTH=304 /DNA_ID=CAMNT_0001743119 /DNA_START=72 /DNA_END=986 /DNA_ORIENTATION=+
MSVSYKARHGDDLRRFSTPREIQFEELKKRVATLFHLESPVLKYLDADGDAVTVSSEEELLEMLRVSPTTSLIRLEVSRNAQGHQETSPDEVDSDLQHINKLIQAACDSLAIPYDDAMSLSRKIDPEEVRAWIQMFPTVSHCAAAFRCTPRQEAPQHPEPQEGGAAPDPRHVSSEDNKPVDPTARRAPSSPLNLSQITQMMGFSHGDVQQMAQQFGFTPRHMQHLDKALSGFQSHLSAASAASAAGLQGFNEPAAEALPDGVSAQRLSCLEAMGFCDREANIKALATSKGDLDECVAALLEARV